MTTLPLLHDVIDGLAVLVCGLDDAGRILLFNRPCEDATGLARDRALGTSWLELFASDERHDHVLALWSQAATGQPAGPYEALCRNRRSVRWQFSRWEHGAQAPVAPAPVTLWAVGIDITDEREALTRAREAERMAALGNLVSGLTHELRNPLNGALLQLALAERHTARGHAGATTPAGEAIGHAVTEIRRISALLDDFLVFVRPRPVRIERLDVRHLVERAIVRGQAKALAAGVELVLEPGDPVGGEVDASRVETAVYQLLANAIDASVDAGSGVVEIRLDVRGNAIAIEVVDRGAGLPATDAPVFEPFFTTKQGGTGLGLTIVDSVAADHGGKVDHERRDGATVFRLVLPIVGGAPN
jgi:PAS domain S-box-containing protein